jgi:hypothetical protein
VPLKTSVPVIKKQENTLLIFSFSDSIDLFRLRHKSSADRHHYEGGGIGLGQKLYLKKLSAKTNWFWRQWVTVFMA